MYYIIRDEKYSTNVNSKPIQKLYYGFALQSTIEQSIWFNRTTLFYAYRYYNVIWI